MSVWIINLASVACGLCVLWACLCRVNALQAGITRPVVFWQHAALAAGVAGGLLLSPDFGRLALMVGLLVFMAAGAWRRRQGAPDDVRLHREVSRE